MSKTPLRRLQLAGGPAAVGTGLALVGSVAAPALAACTGSTIANAAVLSTVTLSGLTPSFTMSGDPNSTVTAATTLAPVTAGNTGSIAIANLKVKETGSASTGDPVSNDFQLAIPFVNSDTYRVTLNDVAA
jgi:hypothetical protein